MVWDVYKYVKSTKGGIYMHYKTAYKKFKNAKVDALSNSTNIQVGRLELNKALKALENMEKLADIYER